MKKVPVEFTESQLDNVIEFIEMEFIDSLRRDEGIDNINYVIDMMNALQAMRFAAYHGRKHHAEVYLCQLD